MPKPTALLSSDESSDASDGEWEDNEQEHKVECTNAAMKSLKRFQTQDRSVEKWANETAVSFYIEHECSFAAFVCEKNC